MKIITSTTVYPPDFDRYKHVKVTTDIEIGRWPYEAGASGFVSAFGEYKKLPNVSAAVWSFTWDDSDDPKVAKWQSTDSNMTKKEAKAFGVTKIKELFERRKKLFM